MKLTPRFPRIQGTLQIGFFFLPKSIQTGSLGLVVTTINEADVQSKQKQCSGAGRLNENLQEVVSDVHVSTFICVFSK